MNLDGDRSLYSGEYGKVSADGVGYGVDGAENSALTFLVDTRYCKSFTVIPNTEDIGTDGTAVGIMLKPLNSLLANAGSSDDFKVAIPGGSWDSGFGGVVYRNTALRGNPVPVVVDDDEVNPVAFVEVSFKAGQDTDAIRSFSLVSNDNQPIGVLPANKWSATDIKAYPTDAATVDPNSVPGSLTDLFADEMPDTSNAYRGMFVKLRMTSGLNGTTAGWVFDGSAWHPVHHYFTPVP
ncbi:MAG: hypothetical protein U0795_16440 [Pirellulales bacterium]